MQACNEKNSAYCLLDGCNDVFRFLATRRHCCVEHWANLLPPGTPSCYGTMKTQQSNTTYTQHSTTCSTCRWFSFQPCYIHAEVFVSTEHVVAVLADRLMVGVLVIGFVQCMCIMLADWCACIWAGAREQYGLARTTYLPTDPSTCTGLSICKLALSGARSCACIE